MRSPHQVLWSSIAGRIAGRLAGVKVILHIANMETGGFRDRELPPGTARKARLLAKLDGWTGRRFVDRFVADQRGRAGRPESRRRRLDRSRIDVVLRGQELEELRERAAEPVSPPLDAAGPPVLLCVGRLAEQKGTASCSRPCRRSHRRAFPEARLLLAGDGHLRPVLQAQAAPFGDRVSFLGMREDVPALVAHADLFVFPSLWEGQGNALLEAMAVGVPIVATNMPSTRETVTDGEHALLVPPGDALHWPRRSTGCSRTLPWPPGWQTPPECARRTTTSSETTHDLEAVYTRVLV